MIRLNLHAPSGFSHLPVLAFSLSVEANSADCSYRQESIKGKNSEKTSWMLSVITQNQLDRVILCSRRAVCIITLTLSQINIIRTNGENLRQLRYNDWIWQISCSVWSFSHQTSYSTKLNKTKIKHYTLSDYAYDSWNLTSCRNSKQQKRQLSTIFTWRQSCFHMRQLPFLLFHRFLNCNLF